MKRLLVAKNAFHAQVIRARLSQEGIDAHIVGPSSDIYPASSIANGMSEVWVSSEDEADAREVLLADEVDAAFLESNDKSTLVVKALTKWQKLILAFCLVVAILLALGVIATYL